jgi:hypothetical protein
VPDAALAVPVTLLVLAVAFATPDALCEVAALTEWPSDEPEALAAPEAAAAALAYPPTAWQ